MPGSATTTGARGVVGLRERLRAVVGLRGLVVGVDDLRVARRHILHFFASNFTFFFEPPPSLTIYNRYVTSKPKQE